MKPEQLYIVTDNPFIIQRKCQKHCKDVFTAFFIGMMIYYVFATLVPELLGLVFPRSYVDVLLSMNHLSAGQLGIDTSKLPDTPAVYFLYSLCFTGVLQAGRALYALTFLRNRKADYMALAEGLSLAGKAILMYLVETLIISLWMVCFIIPGIVAYYNFRQAFFILADDPSKGIMQCLAESKVRMIGNRMALFRLDISYLTLVLTGYIPILAMDYFNPLASNNLAQVLVYFVIQIPYFYALSVMLVGQTAFYELLISHGFQNFKYQGEEAFRESYKEPQNQAMSIFPMNPREEEKRDIHIIPKYPEAQDNPDDSDNDSTDSDDE